MGYFNQSIFYSVAYSLTFTVLHRPMNLSVDLEDEAQGKYIKVHSK